MHRIFFSTLRSWFVNCSFIEFLMHHSLFLQGHNYFGGQLKRSFSANDVNAKASRNNRPPPSPLQEEAEEGMTNGISPSIISLFHLINRRGCRIRQTIKRRSEIFIQKRTTKTIIQQRKIFKPIDHFLSLSLSIDQQERPEDSMDTHSDRYESSKITTRKARV